jgi:tellurite methyltransferase
MNFLIFLTSILFIINHADANRNPISGSRYQQLAGVKTSQDSKTQWDQRYSRSTFIFGKSPAQFLAENYQYIPFEGSVLDMGMGEGRNAVFLAQKGYKVTGVDLSSVAIKKSHLLAQEFGVKIKGVVASLNDYQIPPASYDAIICFYWVDRSMIEKIKTWLRPKGILIYEAHTIRERQRDPNKRSEPEDQFLKDQELLRLFSGMRVLKYEEPLHENQFRSSIILMKE